MKNFITQDYSDNQKKLLQLIYSEKGITRQDLVRLSALSALTVSRFISGFISDGIVIENGTVESKGGRKPIVLEINPDFASIIAVDVGASFVRIGLVSINGVVIEKMEFSYPLEVAPAHVLLPDELVEKIQYLFNKYAESHIIGIGFGISGLVNDKEGRIIFCPNIAGYDNFPIKSFLEEKFNTRVFVNTSARCMALAEQRFGAGMNYAHQIFVSIGHSISAGIIINSSIFTGAEGFSGEIGHLSTTSRGIQCTCGNYDCLETHATLPMIIEYIAEKLKQPNVFSVAKTMVANLDDLDVETINKSLNSGDKVIYSILDEIGTEIGDVFTSLTNILNPEIIILGGGVIECFPNLMEPIIRTLKQKTLITNQQNLKVEKSKLGFDCGLLGSATQVINAFLE